MFVFDINRQPELQTKLVWFSRQVLDNFECALHAVLLQSFVDRYTSTFQRDSVSASIDACCPT